jgi:leucine dehydrogenase
MFDDIVRDWHGELLASRHDAAVGAWMFVGVHSTVLGPAFGGTRMKTYADVAAAVHDVTRLSAAMTSKNAIAGLPFGGGKAVLAVPTVPDGETRRDFLRRYAAMLETLGGSYITACDMNTSERDMDVVAGVTDHVMGTTVDHGGSGSSAPDTAIGVYHGIRAALRYALGSDDPAGRTVVLQGAGAVGSHLAELLTGAGAKVTIADVDPARAGAVAAAAGADTAPAGAEYDLECDVFSPCATGGVLNAATIPRLRCRIVAGAANNQLADDADAERLADARITYAPDVVVNAGGVLHLAGYERLGWSPERMRTRLEAIGDTLLEVLEIAAAQDITSVSAADELVRRRLATAQTVAGRS